MGSGGELLTDTVRAPKDDEERARFERALERGAGMSLERFIERITGEEPDEELVESIRAALQMHSESGEPADGRKPVENWLAWRIEMT